MELAIQTEQLTKRFGTRVVVNDISLAVQSGAIFGFLGPNGAGKTTTIAMLLGLVRPSAGWVRLFGIDIPQHATRALQQVGAMIEAPAFYPYLSGYDNLRVMTRAGGLPDSAANHALTLVDLVAHSHALFRTYSQGMRQRLGIAAALLHNPRLIILDEPTNGLDPAGQIEIRGLIRSLAERGHTIFLSSHMLHEVEQLCDQVAILKAGTVMLQGSVHELLHREPQLIVRIAGDQSAAIPLLQAIPWIQRVERHADYLVLTAPLERSAEINTLLVQQAIPVAEIRAREERLEEMFLAVTADRDAP
ncbi:MAG TPA: ABC transporter ATP-binding protein [Roseiflexaceae bacterium]|nr:ABC transporter ATP-binding protein [Roseiflexaceae bacterium]